MKNCTDCANWNPDLPQGHYCDQNQNPGVIIWIGHVIFESNNSETFVPDASECSCFVQNPWNDTQPPPPAHECDLCLGTGFVDEDDCPECHGLGTYSFSA
jgi:hypothetical protein